MASILNIQKVNSHVPATGTTSDGKVLKAGATPGSIGWGGCELTELDDCDTLAPLAGQVLLYDGTKWINDDILDYMPLAINRLWGWGFNNIGQLGDGNQVYRSSPVQTIAGGSNWADISTGGNHTLAISTGL